jgi:hypothetical protein
MKAVYSFVQDIVTWDASKKQQEHVLTRTLWDTKDVSKDATT